MDGHKTSPLIDTHLVLPGWWVRAFETSAIAEWGGSDAGAMEQACLAGIAPALSALELNALAMVLATLQVQLLSLENADNPLSVNAEDHVKHAGTAVRGRRFVFQKVVQLLAGLRLLHASAPDDLQACPIFTADRWLRRQSETGRPRLDIELSLDHLGAELLLGIANPYMDLFRGLRGSQEAGPVIGPEPPLVLWRSAWLEQSGPEQLLFLRLERSMQWEARWLQLEGVFGMTFNALFAGINAAEVRGGAAESSALDRWLKMCARLGRRLIAHGFLTEPTSDQYLAVASEPEPMLVWQAGRERLGEEISQEFQRSVSTYFRLRQGRGLALDLSRLILPTLTNGEHSAKIQDLWSSLAAIDIPAISGLELSPAQPLLPHILFYEYCLRSHPESVLPLPATVAVDSIAELATWTDEVNTQAVQECFRRFCQVLSNSGRERLEAFATQPLLSLASPASRKTDDLKSLAVHWQAGGHSYRLLTTPQGHSEANTKPRLVAATPVIPPPIPSQSNQQAAQAEPARRAAASSGALNSWMLKTATEELNRLRAVDQARYLDLKNAYLNSLDEHGRRLMLDVQKRIQPSLFEQQLHQRLVRYMVENPGSWRSAESGKAGTT